jgi:hypothetical protein
MVYGRADSSMGGVRSALGDTPDRVVYCPQPVDNFVLENCET